jgi:hypothetical protein
MEKGSGCELLEKGSGCELLEKGSGCELLGKGCLYARIDQQQQPIDTWYGMPACLA